MDRALAGRQRARLGAAADATVGFSAPRDPQWLSSLDAMDDELVTDSLVYRYDPQASPDGLEGSEATFSLCTFAYVTALAQAGRVAARQDASLVPRG